MGETKENATAQQQLVGLDLRLKTLDIEQKEHLVKSIKFLFCCQILYSGLGLIIGLIFAGAGVVLFLQGILGASDLKVTLPGAETSLSNAAPGAIFAVLGVLIIWITRFDVKLKAK